VSRVWRLSLFFVLLGLWTWKLLEPFPVPEEIQETLLAAGLKLVAAKTLHAVMYGVLAILAITLPAPLRWRRFFVGLLLLHAIATEIGQTFVPHRTGRAWDVVIDWTGIAMGLALLHLVKRKDAPAAAP
jgi:VanZ family protein